MGSKQSKKKEESAEKGKDKPYEWNPGAVSTWGPAASSAPTPVPEPAPASTTPLSSPGQCLFCDGKVPNESVEAVDQVVAKLPLEEVAKRCLKYGFTGEVYLNHFCTHVAKKDGSAIAAVTASTAAAPACDSKETKPAEAAVVEASKSANPLPNDHKRAREAVEGDADESRALPKKKQHTEDTALSFSPAAPTAPPS
jgi:hypothetical protein